MWKLLLQRRKKRPIDKMSISVPDFSTCTMSLQTIKSNAYFSMFPSCKTIVLRRLLGSTYRSISLPPTNNGRSVFANAKRPQQCDRFPPFVRSGIVGKGRAPRPRVRFFVDCDASPRVVYALTHWGSHASFHPNPPRGGGNPTIEYNLTRGPKRKEGSDGASDGGDTAGFTECD